MTLYIQNDQLDLLPSPKNKIAELIDNKFVVAFDFDGVITNPHALKAKYINERGYSITEAQSSALSCLRLGVKKEDYDVESIRAYTENPKKLPLEKGLLKEFQKIRSIEDISIFILTSRYNHMIPHLQEYLKHHGIQVDGVMNTNNESKGTALRTLQAKIFVDDTPNKLEQIMNHPEALPKDCLLIFYQNIANINERRVLPGVPDVENWQELTQTILQHYKKQHKG